MDDATRRPPAEPLGDGERLQKVLARAGLSAVGGSARTSSPTGGSRSTARSPCSGAGSTPSTTWSRSTACRFGVRAGLVHYLLNKPAGVVTTADDPQGRPTVVDLVPAEPRVFPVGRLDLDTEGLLLLTNDGDLTHRLTHPSFGVDKEYLAEVEGDPVARRGAAAPRGRRARRRAHRAGAGRRWSGRRLIQLIIHEGRNRQVRRMCDAVGHPVAPARAHPHRAARRTGGSSPGPWRPLTDDEVRALETAARPSRHPIGTADPGDGGSGSIADRASAVRALRGATTIDVDTAAQVPSAHRGRCSTEMFERNERRPRRHHQHAVHRHRRHPLALFPAAAARDARPRRRPADLRP